MRLRTLLIVLLLAVCWPTSAQAASAPSSSPSTLVEFLAQVDAGRARVEAASKAYQAALEGRQDASRTLETAQERLAKSATTLTHANAAWEVSSQALQAASDHFDKLVRQLYMTGSAPSPIDLMLVDPSAQLEGAAAHLAYLTSASDSSVLAHNQAQTSFQEAQARREAAAAAFAAAETDLAEAQAAFNAAELGVDAALTEKVQARQELDLLMASFTPASGQGVLPPQQCSNWLVKVLYRAGFTGEDNREAWAIAMRESGGREDAVSSTSDYGMFQFNKPTFGSQPWWDDQLILTRDYNAAVAFELSQGGKSWINWGLDGHGRVNPLFYQRSGWTEDMILDRIVKPYAKFYEMYPCATPAPGPLETSMGVLIPSPQP